RRRDRGRPDRQPGPHALHHTRDLPLPRPPASVDGTRPDGRPAPGHRTSCETGMRRVRSSLVLAVTLLAAGCSVGPNYVRPDAPTSDTYKELGGWRTAQPRDDTLRAAWWDLYDDPVLSGLAEDVAVANQNLAAAEARFRQARTLVWQARSNWFPTVVAGVSFARSR